MSNGTMIKAWIFEWVSLTIKGGHFGDLWH